MAVQIVIPFAGSCPYRLRALEFVRGRLPYPVTIAPGSEPWSKGAAVMAATSSGSDEDVLVIHDADVWCDELQAAVRAVQAGAGWAVPHRTLYRLSEESTARVLAGDDWAGLPLAERAYQGISGGGIVVLRRGTLRECPIDPRFVGWGGEDESWSMALRCLHGPPWRGTAPLVHLWHPPQQRMTRRRGSRESWSLRGRYFAARRDIAAMTALLEEARAALNPAEPADDAAAA